VAAVADRVVILVKGRVVHEGTGAALAADAALRQLHLGV
jgi:ABC-type branched-subunit amino acid transport system ATPase component